jgi:trk system potassium uptake protein TrkH
MSKRPIFANLGFLLQISGLLTLVSVPVGLCLNETEASLSVLLASVTYLGCGFLLNAMCERRELYFESSCAFVLLAFVLMPLVGAVPYVYYDPFNSSGPLDRFTNAYFESISGFTTTGFSFIPNSDVLPRTILLYRSLTELIGGIGIVFLLLVFFQTEESMNSLNETLGIENIGGSLKKTYLSVFVIYVFYVAIFTLLFYLLGIHDVVKAVSSVIDVLTGGFQPSQSQWLQYQSMSMRISLIALMFVGSVNFGFNYHLMTRKLKDLATKELILYLIVLATGTVLVAALSGINVFDSLFHVVSMSSSTGFDYIGIPMLNEAVVGVFIILMILGACSFSMAGGIKIQRIISLLESIKRNVKKIFGKEKYSGIKSGRGTEDLVKYDSAAFSILLFIGTLFVFSMLFSTIGVSFRDALFEVGSALTTNGISMGVTTVSMPIFYKYLLMTSMIIGRIEIVTVLIALWKSDIKVLNLTKLSGPLYRSIKSALSRKRR